MAGREEATWWRAPPCPATCPAHGCVGVQGAENSGLDERERRDIRYGRIAERRGDSPPTQLSPLAARARGSSCAPALDQLHANRGAPTRPPHARPRRQSFCVQFISLVYRGVTLTVQMVFRFTSNGVPASQPGLLSSEMPSSATPAAAQLARVRCPMIAFKRDDDQCLGRPSAASSLWDCLTNKTAESVGSQ